MNKQQLIARILELDEKATPAPWKVNPIEGYTEDIIVTEHKDYQKPPHGNYVAETGLAAGHPKQNFESDSALIAEYRTLAVELAKACKWEPETKRCIEPTQIGS